ncbi:hypothetical protein BH23BAC1_BH23BAC1_25440 [soil metagenome]
MKCSNCGFLNKEDRKVCEKCEASLPKNEQQKVFSKGGGFFGAPATAHGKSRHDQFIDTPNVSNPIPTVTYKCPYCNYYPLKSPVSIDQPCVNCRKTGEIEEKKASGTRSFNNTDFWGPVHQAATLTLMNMQTKQNLKFEGDEHILGRERISPNDQSLSKEHVKFTHEDGQWFLEDISSNGATFIQVTEKVPVGSETMVVLGKNYYKIVFD